ncbi:hypothetical protein RJ639_009805 [Escallonia herrerae]|uniref:Glucosamine/galactosamine-6-phosphate isomerase domain-containing protein n=1 Tax=Escallonia herrerae TaxID=1293975 RepID=A0AA88VUL0_9ASTE|nr:hypothetical protein RJ639_009805 [Escallonia herrerae]
MNNSTSLQSHALPRSADINGEAAQRQSRRPSLDTTKKPPILVVSERNPDLLIIYVPIVPSHVHSINDSLSAEEAADEYEFVIRQLVRTRVVNVSEISDCPKFDIILLGMGPDGHVASLFPNHHPVLVRKMSG